MTHVLLLYLYRDRDIYLFIYLFFDFLGWGASGPRVSPPSSTPNLRSRLILRWAVRPSSCINTQYLCANLHLAVGYHKHGSSITNVATLRVSATIISIASCMHRFISGLGHSVVTTENLRKEFSLRAVLERASGTRFVCAILVASGLATRPRGAPLIICT